MSDYKETLAGFVIILCIVVLVNPEGVGKFWRDVVSGFEQQDGEKAK